MKKHLLFSVLPVSVILLTSCSTTTPPSVSTQVSVPPFAAVPASAIQPTLFGEMQKLSAEILDAGGLAAIGTGESKSLDLALNMAKKNGRIELERRLTAKIEVLEKSFSEETGIPYDSLFLSGFNNTARIIARQQIVGSIAQTLKYEPAGNAFIAYAIMVLDPKAIVDQLAKEKDLFERLQTTKAFEELDKEIRAYEVFKAARK
jgi:hypothetical protein